MISTNGLRHGAKNLGRELAGVDVHRYHFAPSLARVTRPAWLIFDILGGLEKKVCERKTCSSR